MVLRCWSEREAVWVDVFYCFLSCNQRLAFALRLLFSVVVVVVVVVVFACVTAVDGPPVDGRLLRRADTNFPLQRCANNFSFVFVLC